MSSYMEYEPRRHSAVSGLAVETVEGAKGGIGGAIRGGLFGLLLGATVVGLGSALFAYGLGLATSALALTGVGVGAGVLSVVTPGLNLIPFGIGGALAAIGGGVGVYRGAGRGAERVAGEQASSRMMQAHDAEMAAYRDMAKARGLEAQADIATAQAYVIAQQGAGTPDAARVTAAVAAPKAPEAGTVKAPDAGVVKASNPLLQAESTRVDAATIAQMGLASMPMQHMGKA